MAITQGTKILKTDFPENSGSFQLTHLIDLEVTLSSNVYYVRERYNVHTFSYTNGKITGRTVSVSYYSGWIPCGIYDIVSGACYTACDCITGDIC